ncbi:phosphonate C-P lyase system protein PhnH [Roseovarius autotrophicus]|uniref:phosphonate C-P lyase system protein PhnH n=1 Tax=Roseovarius autotrophicus TaxID=2824121 RepID=UPI0019D9972D|nr:phosphonate C-P lyase system protein PhnH [Roseovarius autotrophicus]MBE0454775.1 phosphonate C-P lyase system protein PhnH [Roseovarius sp.]
MSVLDLPRLWRPETHQALFRRILDATARPGTLADTADLTEGAPAALAALATFCDNTQTLADLTGSLGATDWAFLDVARAAPEAADFILADGATAPGFTPRLGTLDLPDGGATVIVTVAALDGGATLVLQGPGIKDSRSIAPRGLAPGWLAARARWCADFPMGVDFVLADGQSLMILPRTTQITGA